MMRDFEDKEPVRFSIGEKVFLAFALVMMIAGYIGAVRMLWSAIRSLF